MTIEQTSRLRLEPLAEHHAPGMQTAMADERIYAYIADTRHSDADSLRLRYRRLAAGCPDAGEVWLNFILFVNDASDPIGFVQASIFPAKGLAELAYVLTPSAWGRGLATEAMHWLFDHLRARDDVRTLEVRIDARNLASLTLAKRLDFRFDRTITEDGIVDHLFTRPLATAAT